MFGGGDEASAVGVFDAQDELAAALARINVIDQADVGGADVGVAGWTGSDADAYGSFGINRHKGQELMLAEGAPSIFLSVHWYLSQLIQSAHCDMIHWGNSSNGDAEPKCQQNSEYLRLDDVSGETIL